MPIDTTSQVWDSQEVESSTRTNVLEFLTENSSKAYSARELSDELLGTRWEKVHEKQSLIDDIGEDEYYGLPEEDQIDETVLANMRPTDSIKSHLSALVYEGHLEVRSVPIEESAQPVTEDMEGIDLPHYTYAGD